MNDIRELIRKLVELNSAQGIEKVIVRQAGVYGNISIDSVHVEDDFAVIETEVLSKKEDDKEEVVKEEPEVSLSVGPDKAHALVIESSHELSERIKDTEEDVEETEEAEDEPEIPEPSEKETSVKKRKKEEVVEEA